MRDAGNVENIQLDVAGLPSAICPTKMKEVNRREVRSDNDYWNTKTSICPQMIYEAENFILYRGEMIQNLMPRSENL